MARPRRKGLDYFPFDIDLFQDIKVRKLLKRHGAGSVTVFSVLLCSIYREGYFIHWDEDLPFIISETTRMEEEEIMDIIESCLQIGLFSEEMFRNHQVLTSRAIQERCVKIASSTKREVNISEFNLINSEKTTVSSELIPVSSEETHINSEETPQNKELTPNKPEFPPNSFIKENKENKIKEDEEEKKEEVPPSSPPVNSEEIIFKEIEMLKSPGVSHWRDTLCEEYRLSPEEMTAKLDKFARHCHCEGKYRHKDFSDLQSHFNRWLKKQSSSAKTRGKTTTASQQIVTKNKITPEQQLREIEATIRENELHQQQIKETRGGGDKLIRRYGYDPSKVKIYNVLNPEWRAANPPEFPVQVEPVMA